MKGFILLEASEGLAQQSKAALALIAMKQSRGCVHLSFPSLHQSVGCCGPQPERVSPQLTIFEDTLTVPLRGTTGQPPR